MDIQDIHLEYYDWDITIIYGCKVNNIEAVKMIMFNKDVPENIIRKSVELLKRGEYNNALTYTNISKRRSIVVFGESSDSREFFNTFQHETWHLVNQIIESLGIDSSSEEPAYLAGYIAFETQPISHRYICSRCS